MRRILLSDEQLWRAITENTTELSSLLDEEIESIPTTGIQQAKLTQFNKLQRQYQAFAAELRRRYS